MKLAKMLQSKIIAIEPWKLWRCEDLWFQQEAPTCHKAQITINFLKELELRTGIVAGPPNTCNLSPLDYMLRGPTP